MPYDFDQGSYERQFTHKWRIFLFRRFIMSYLINIIGEFGDNILAKEPLAFFQDDLKNYSNLLQAISLIFSDGFYSKHFFVQIYNLVLSYIMNPQQPAFFTKKPSFYSFFDGLKDFLDFLDLKDPEVKASRSAHLNFQQLKNVLLVLASYGSNKKPVTMPFNQDISNDVNHFFSTFNHWLQFFYFFKKFYQLASSAKASGD
jgi:hypothetical protein